MVDFLARRGLPQREFLVFVVVLALCLPRTTLLYADEAMDSYRAAVGFYKQRRYQKSAEQFRNFLKTYENHDKAPLGRLYLGLSLVYLDDYKTARDELRRFASENKQNDNISLAQFRIAECSYLMDDLASAKTELEDFVKVFPESGMCEHALPYLGDTLLRTEPPDTDLALAMFDRAIEKFPQGQLIDDAKFGRARSLESLKRFDEAATQYEELVTRENSPRAADALFHSGAIYYERNDFTKALKAYTEFVDKFPKNALVPNAQLNAGYALFHLKRFDEALKYFDKVAKDPAQKLTAAYWQGRCLKSMRDFTKAAEILKSASEVAGNHPLAEAILFERALCERSLDRPVQARQLFELVLNRFPTGDYADDSLHYLIESAIEGGDLVESARLLELFNQNYPQSPHRLLIEMLNGRLDLARATVKLSEKRPREELNPLYESAARRFEQVLNESSIVRAKRQARYYLALTYQLQENPTKALETIAPLIAEVTADPSLTDFTEAWVLQADCYLQLEEADKARSAATKYLEVAPKGRQAVRALSTQVLAGISLSDSQAVDAGVARLTRDFPEHPMTSMTLQKWADASENNKDWVAAIRANELILTTQKDPEARVYAMRGIALALYSQAQYPEASAMFGRVLSEFPKHEVATECAYYEADSYWKAADSAKALERFQRLFDSNPQTEAAESGEEGQPPLVFYYRAGRWVTNILTSMNKLEDADAAFESLLKRFPKPSDLDARLKDWALLNANHERYERADQIWHRLLAEVPDSAYASLAKLYLAESDLFADKLVQARQAFEELANDEKCKDEIREQSLFQLVTLAVDQERWADVRTTGDRLLELSPKSKYRYYVIYTQAEMYFTNPRQSEESSEVVRDKLKSLQAEVSNEPVRNSVWFERVWVLLAELNFQERKYEDVVDVVKDLRALNPKSAFLYQADEVLGRSYKQQAPPRFDDARAAFERVVSDPQWKKTETAAKAQFQIGDTYVFQNRWDEAVEAYNKVYSIYEFPYWKAEALLALAKCDDVRQDWKSVINTCKLLIESYPDFAKIDQAKTLLSTAQKKVGS